MPLFQKKKHRKDFIKRLQDDYFNEMQLSQQMHHHAEVARYRHYREQLLQLAESEKRQAGMIKEMIEKLGEEVPEKIPGVKLDENRNLFEALTRDLEMDHQDYFHYFDRIHQAEEEGLTELVPTLNQLREEELQHRETLLFILQRLNPYQV